MLNAWLSTGSAFVAEILTVPGFGNLMVDLQHGLVTEDCLAPALQAIRASGMTSITRVAGLDLPAINRVGDIGAMAIVYPMIETADEAWALVAAVRYPPDGRRSHGPTRAAVVEDADYAATANRRIACLALIETARAIDKLQEIVAAPGLDGVYIGPYDLAFSMIEVALPPGFDREEPMPIKTIFDIAATAHGAGKRVPARCPPILTRKRTPLVPVASKERLCAATD